MISKWILILLQFSKREKGILRTLGKTVFNGILIAQLLLVKNLMNQVHNEITTVGNTKII